MGDDEEGSETAARSPALQGDCAACGFRASSVVPDNAADTVRKIGGRFRSALTRRGVGDADLRTRPGATTWSALEYAAHVRDVIAVWGWSLHRTLTDDEPELPGPDPDLPDRAAAEGSYNAQRPSTVIEDLSANAERMARKLASIEGEAWSRSATFGDVHVTPIDIARKVAHESEHHLLDIGRCLQVRPGG